MIAYYGYAEGQGPYLCTAWAAPAQRRDSNLLSAAFTAKIYSDLPLLEGAGEPRLRPQHTEILNP
jgi:hypothetical protein